MQIQKLKFDFESGAPALCSATGSLPFPEKSYLEEFFNQGKTLQLCAWEARVGGANDDLQLDYRQGESTSWVCLTLPDAVTVVYTQDEVAVDFTSSSRPHLNLIQDFLKQWGKEAVRQASFLLSKAKIIWILDDDQSTAQFSYSDITDASCRAQKQKSVPRTRVHYGGSDKRQDMPPSPREAFFAHLEKIHQRQTH